MGVRRIRRETWGGSKSQRFVVVWSPFEAFGGVYSDSSDADFGSEVRNIRSHCMRYAMGGDQKSRREAARGSAW